MPPPGKKLVVFIDDINMPSVEQYGAQPPIELLRFIQDYNNLYDRKSFGLKDIENTILLAACAPPGGGRSQTTVRFMRHFNQCSMPNHSNTSLALIFSSILTGFLKINNFRPEIIEISENQSLVEATLIIY